MSQNPDTPASSRTSGADRLFCDRKVREDFAFTGEVAAVFDDMLLRSVPCCQQAAEAAAQLLERHLPEGALIYDLGCSVGTNVPVLVKGLKNRSFRYIGVDKAPAMLSRARARFPESEALRFLEADITTCPLDGAQAILCNYTLQFLRPLERPAFVRRVFAALPPGGLFILSEKTIALSPALNRDFIALHHDFKRAQGYTEMEIAAKREALENVLVPFSLEENVRLLREAGFAEVEPFFVWFNFSSIAALKR